MALQGPYEFSRSNFCQKMRSVVERGASETSTKGHTVLWRTFFLSPVSVNAENSQVNVTYSFISQRSPENPFLQAQCSFSQKPLHTPPFWHCYKVKIICSIKFEKKNY